MPTNKNRNKSGKFNKNYAGGAQKEPAKYKGTGGSKKIGGGRTGYKDNSGGYKGSSDSYKSGSGGYKGGSGGYKSSSDGYKGGSGGYKDSFNKYQDKKHKSYGDGGGSDHANKGRFDSKINSSSGNGFKGKTYGDKSYNKKSYNKQYSNKTAGSKYNEKRQNDYKKHNYDSTKSNAIINEKDVYISDEGFYNEEIYTKADHFDAALEDVTNKSDMQNENQTGEGVIVGRNAVREAVRSGRSIDKIFVSSPGREGSIKLIIAEALARKIPVIEVGRSKIEQLAFDTPHQGVAALIPSREYSTVDEILETAKERGEKPLIIVADGLEDPHNLGAIIRTAECAGAHGLIIPKRRSASLTPAVVKAAAGATEHLKIAKVSNLSQTLIRLKQQGLWIYAADMDGTPYTECSFSEPTVIIVGGEGEGVSQNLKKASDYIVGIPIRGAIESLNVSNAAAVILFEVLRQRGAENTINQQ